MNPLRLFLQQISASGGVQPGIDFDQGWKVRSVREEKNGGIRSYLYGIWPTQVDTGKLFRARAHSLSDFGVDGVVIRSPRGELP